MIMTLPLLKEGATRRWFKAIKHIPIYLYCLEIVNVKVGARNYLTISYNKKNKQLFSLFIFQNVIRTSAEDYLLGLE